MKEKLDVFKILSENKDDRLDVFEILRPDMKDNQEQHNAPDFDLFNNIGQAEVQEPPQQEIQPAPAAPKVSMEIALAPKTTPEPAPAKKQPAPRREKSHHLSSMLRVIIKAAVLIAAIILFAAFVLVGTRVQTDSMAPLISKGDWVLVNKTAKSYGCNDIIMFKDSGDRKCVARIIAADGDLVDINKNGGLIINSKPEDREGILGETHRTDVNVQYPVLVSEGEFFVLGDNRENSEDSRNYHIGNITEKQIIGKVVYCYKIIK